ncbi:type III-B CRISPR module RAMP protein Cmr6 [Aneurinibacillus sp. UBA3580]|jgi:CRISPR-associated protein Cmr6|uniref:type III-B CRISPR module RAMP protein Cmr6 n=1 Tax=Aneurinibacillus sp. UBA3580 TaxID=1946041 RepID=UPI00257D6502|nr:type III-B CRISPR module RAMP protein Cmr6 [Aneurinibacillus sp. UBA3580]
MKEKGMIRVTKTKKGHFDAKLDIGGKILPAPFLKQTDDSLNGKECEIVREKGQVKELWIDGTMRYGQRKQQEKTYSLPDSLSIKDTFLPKDTRELDIQDIDNFGLKLNKAARYEKGWRREQADYKFVFHKPKKDTKKENIPGFMIRADFRNLPIEMLAQRNRDAVEKSLSYVETISLHFPGKLAIGLGQHSVYETSLTLHPVYGMPYLPGSSLKGVAANYVIAEYFGGEEKTAYEDDGFVLLFGNQKHKGSVSFFDALPTAHPNVEVDMLTPHYGAYYGKGRAPGDYGKPVPVPFLVVKNTPFQVMIGTKENSIIPDGKWKGKKVLDVAREELVRALMETGIGAKTAIGYGAGEIE